MKKRVSKINNQLLDVAKGLIILSKYTNNVGGDFHEGIWAGAHLWVSGRDQDKLARLGWYYHSTRKLWMKPLESFT